MVRTYKRKTDRASVPLQAYEAAIKDVDRGKTIRQAAKDHGVCHVSLYRRLKKRESGDDYNTTFSKHKKVFTEEQELELAKYIHQCAEAHFGLSAIEVRRLAYQCANKFEIGTPSSWDDAEAAGEDWFLSFRKRHNFSLRKAENTSLGRVIGFNRPAVQLFYDNLERVMSRRFYGPHQIYNVDETGVSTVPSSARVVAKTGSRSVGRVVSAEKGTLVTLVCAINAIGNSIPPMFIFPRKNFKSHFILGAPPGSTGIANGSGWIKEADWLEYVRHFVKFAKPSAESPVLLLLDNHVSHLYVPAIDLCKENHVTVLSLPPHTSHKMQPLDRVVYGPLKTYIANRCHGWTRENPGRALSIYDIPGIVGSELPRAMTQHNIIESFRCTGIWPVNQHVFTDSDFAAAEVTDRPLSANPVPASQPGPSSTASAQPGPSSTASAQPRPSSTASAQPGPSSTASAQPGPSSTASAQPGPSSTASGQPVAMSTTLTTATISSMYPLSTPTALSRENTNTTDAPVTLSDHSNAQPSTPIRPPTSGISSSAKHFSPELVMPFPKASRKPTAANDRRRRRSAILTDSPVKKALEALEKPKLAPKLCKRGGKTGLPVKGKGKAKPVKTRVRHTSTSSSSSDNEENICLVCAERFEDSRSGEQWIQCSGCQLWAHEDCTDIGSKSLVYICQNCMSD